MRTTATAHRRRPGGGDQLAIKLELAANSCALITSVAAQKIYGTRGRSRLDPNGRWAEIKLQSKLAAGADLEWLPQETVVFEGGLLQQQHRVELAENASWLGIDVVRLGRTARGKPWVAVAGAAALKYGVI